jgi:pyruvate,water dikinase
MMKTADVEAVTIDRVSSGYLAVAVRGSLAAVRQAVNAGSAAVEQYGELRAAQVYPKPHLVCPATSPAWAPVFARVAATVSDVGGIMSHTAIVCREYGMPAVVGTGNAVATLHTGQRVRVDGSSGVVTVLEPA